jgi:ABC-type branched-subunit amino acid transport system permease subunit
VFWLNFATRLVCLSIAAVSLNLILGFGGLISFGHAAYIGIGAYMVGIPAYHGYESGWLHIPLAMGVSALFALVTGRDLPAHQGRLLHHDHHGVCADGVLLLPVAGRVWRR